jgi:hypothetical protein
VIAPEMTPTEAGSRVNGRVNWTGSLSSMRWFGDDLADEHARRPDDASGKPVVTRRAARRCLAFGSDTERCGGPATFVVGRRPADAPRPALASAARTGRAPGRPSITGAAARTVRRADGAVEVVGGFEQVLHDPRT